MANGHAGEALASDTRREIMKCLCEKSYRPADLSRELEKDRSTITEHLRTLSEAGLVERVEREGHKWVFYRLSREGMTLFPNQRRRIIYIALALLSFAGAMMSMFAYFQPQSPEVAGAAPSYEVRTLQLDSSNAEKAVGGAGQNDVYLYAAAALMVLCAFAALQVILRKGSELVLPRNRA